LNRALLTNKNILKTHRAEDIPELELELLPVSNLNNGMAAVAIDKIISKRNIEDHHNKVLECKRLAGEEQITMDKMRKMTSGKYWLNKKAKNRLDEDCLVQEIAYITTVQETEKKKQQKKVVTTLKLFKKVDKVKAKNETTWNLKERFIQCLSTRRSRAMGSCHKRYLKQ
jgi:hypothetical protein